MTFIEEVKGWMSWEVQNRVLLREYGENMIEAAASYHCREELIEFADVMDGKGIERVDSDMDEDRGWLYLYFEC